MTRVLYIQYTNPGGYPPLEHSSAILAEGGAQVLVLGTTAPWMKRMAWPDRPGITVRIGSRRERGMGQRIDYLRYAAGVVRSALQQRPDWLYASDAFSAPIALAVRRLTGARVVYHEHDEPFAENLSGFMRLILAARARLAREAEEVVVPNAERGERLRRATGRQAPVRVVWNCPRRAEVRPHAATPSGALRILYQGSIARERVPLTLIDAMADVPDAHLVVIGYEPPGAVGHLDALRQRAAARGVSERLEILGEIPRSEILEVTSGCHVGLSFRASGSADPNEATMVGSSNKAFEYLACGLALLVGETRDWHDTFVAPGLAAPCNPLDRTSLAEALRWFANNREAAAAMGLKGQQRIRDRWNYESQFRELAELMLGHKSLASLATSRSEGVGEAAPHAR